MAHFVEEVAPGTITIHHKKDPGRFRPGSLVLTCYEGLISYQAMRPSN